MADPAWGRIKVITTVSLSIRISATRPEELCKEQSYVMKGGQAHLCLLDLVLLPVFETEGAGFTAIPNSVAKRRKSARWMASKLHRSMMGQRPSCMIRFVAAKHFFRVPCFPPLIVSCQASEAGRAGFYSAGMRP
jgi:hypothetical protein